MDDRDGDELTLLRRFAEHGDQAAFARLVERYLPMVHAMARRIAPTGEMAQDIAQQTFIQLARDARRVRPQQGVAAWLHAATRSFALRALRTDSRRRLRERRAIDLMTSSHEDSTAGWEELAPCIDDLVAGLPLADRRLVLMRYYENRSLRAAAETLGLSEEAARKRLSRALEKLRDSLRRRGIATTTVALSGLLPLHAAGTAVPAGLSASICTAAKVVTPAAASFFSASTFLTLMTTTQKIAIAGGVAASITAVALLANHAAAPAPAGGHRSVSSPWSSDSAGPEAAVSSRSSEEGPPDRARPRAAEVQKKGLRRSMPEDRLVALLRQQMAPSGGINALEEKLAGCCDLLGATDAEREKVQAAVAKARTDLLDAEKRLLKPVKSGESSVSLDLSPMEGEAKRAADNLRDWLSQSLPDDLSGPLAEAVDWDQFYFQNGADRNFTFELGRKDDTLVAKFSNGITSISQNVPEDLKDDGHPVPADQAFSSLQGPPKDSPEARSHQWPDVSRFAELMKGITLASPPVGEGH